MIINCLNLPWPLSKRLINLLQHEISAVGFNGNSGSVVTFRDPEYDCSSGGYHPVEIAVTRDGSIAYITDFALYGMPPHAELVKEIDFDFQQGLFQHKGENYPIRHGRDLYQMWENNFVSYYQMDAYRIEVAPWG